MSEQGLTLAEAVRLAAEAEKQAVEFYRGAAGKASKDALRQLFNGLADLEQFHYDKVIELTLSLQKQGKFLFYEGCTLSIAAQSEIDFAKEAGETLEAAKLSLMDVLTAAQNVEVGVSKRYTELAKQTDDPDGKDMFLKLAREEQRHLRLLTDVYWNLNDHGVLRWPKM
jgi:rubrerythrin